MAEQYHDPVLLKEAVDALNIDPAGIYIDATFGGGGHSKEIISRLKTGRLIAFDQDADAIRNRWADDRLTLVHDNFGNMEMHLQELNVIPVNGILADLGISSHQINMAERGFSTRYEATLDMRMDQRSDFSAVDILNEYSEKQLTEIFSAYGEIRNSKQLANAIVKSRTSGKITTTSEFKKAIQHCIPFNKEHQYLAQVFQSLRIEVNGEMDVLSKFLESTGRVLTEGGRLVVIAYHSLEDRMVKNLISTGNIKGEMQKDLYGNITGLQLRSLTRKAVAPGEEEIARNPRSRSAKMRIAEKI